MNDDYVRKDIFEEVIKRIEAQTAASEARTAALIAEIRADVKAYKADSDAKLREYRSDSRRESESLASDMRALKDAVKDLKESANRRWTIATVFVGIMGVLIPLWPTIKAALGL